MKRYVILASLTALLIYGAISIRMEETPPEPQPAREEVLIPAPQGEASESRVRASCTIWKNIFPSTVS